LRYKDNTMEWSEKIIIDKLKNKELAIFEQIFNEYFTPLTYFCYKYIENKQASEDIVQELFVKLWQHSETLEINISLKNYLYRWAANSSLNYLKHQKIKLKYQHFVEKELENQIQEADDKLATSELEEKLTNAINKLPEKCREVFILSRYENLKYQEIADKLQISVKTVENQISKALKTLRTEFFPLIILFFSFLSSF